MTEPHEDPDPETPTEWIDHVKVVAPELYEEFTKRQRDVDILWTQQPTAGLYTTMVPVCQRCGATVGEWDKHVLWHRHLSLTIWMFGSVLRGMAEASDTIKKV